MGRIDVESEAVKRVAALAVIVLVGLALSASASGWPPYQHKEFRDPSGNIDCFLAERLPSYEFAYCLLVSKWVLYDLKRRGPAWVVHPPKDGSWRPDGTKFVLGYGRSVHVGPFKCVSRVKGLTCVSLVSGHGFFISRERQRRF